MVVTEEGKYQFVHKVVPEIIPKKTSQALNRKLFGNILSRALQNIWRKMNSTTSILRETMLVYLKTKTEKYPFFTNAVWIYDSVEMKNVGVKIDIQSSFHFWTDN